jgi:hypothetical protein
MKKRVTKKKSRNIFKLEWATGPLSAILALGALKTFAADPRSPLYAHDRVLILTTCNLLLDLVHSRMMKFRGKKKEKHEGSTRNAGSTRTKHHVHH